MSVCLDNNNFKSNFNNSCNNSYSSQITSISVEPSFLVVPKRGDLLKQMSLLVNRSRQRRALAKLDARMLADIGCSAEQVRQELSKPFWK